VAVAVAAARERSATSTDANPWAQEAQQLFEASAAGFLSLTSCVRAELDKRPADLSKTKLLSAALDSLKGVASFLHAFGVSFVFLFFF